MARESIHKAILTIQPVKRSSSRRTNADIDPRDIDIRARRELIKAAYRADGFSESYIADHVTDDLAEKMIRYERETVAVVARLVGVAA